MTTCSPLMTSTQRKIKKPSYLLGDFNFNLLLNTDNSETFFFFETMMSSHLIPTITVPTKINTKKSTGIDNTFINQITLI